MLSAEQLKERKKGIGGSDAAAVCGVSKWRTPVQVYLEKVSPGVEEITNPIFERGHVLEPLVRRLFEKELGKEVRLQPQTLKHDKYHFMLANIDGYLPDKKALFEAKTASYRTRSSWGEPMTDQIPDDYFCQVQHYMAVTNTLSTYVGVLMGDDVMLSTLTVFVKRDGVEAVLQQGLALDFKVYQVRRDDHFIDRMIKIEDDFWINNVTTGHAPEHTSCEDLRALFPQAKAEKAKIASEEIMTLFAQRQYVKEQMDHFDVQVKELDAQLMDFMKDAEELVDTDGMRLATWKNMTRKLFYTSKFKQELPEMYHQF